MMVVRRVVGPIPIFAACLAMVLHVGVAQKTAAPSPEKTRQILIANARALEARGRPDMAIQIWQQILLSDPKNPEALAGLARDYRLSGSSKESDQTLEKLRAINPSDPNIAKIQGLASNKSQSDQLRKAGDLARQGHNEEAMRIYRQLYGDHPPDGDIALAYYQTMYGTTSGKDQAITAMRALEQRNPGDSRYAIELGRMLTYDPKTRAEGIHILEQHPQDPNARNSLRQALIWDSANPASAAELRNYLKAHPEDAEIAGHLKENETKLAQMNSGIARTPEEKAAFAALNAKHLEDAQKRFMEILQKEPTNGRAMAGMGFLRMQQQNFAGAVSYLTQAEQNGYKAASVENALATSRFWYTMGEASQAFDGSQFDIAEQKYKDALAMRPKSTEALNGLAGLYTKEQQYDKAAQVYQELLKLQPSNLDAHRGIFLAHARDGENQKALAFAAKFPPRIKAELSKDPEYLRTLATIYHAQGRDADAQKVLSQALALPFPEGGAHLKQDTRLQYAGILMESNRFDQAAALYTQILNDDGNNLPAWMGLVSAHHQLGHDDLAIADVEKMPPAAYESALSDSGFLTMLGSIYQQANQLDIAQSLLERSVKLQMATGAQPSLQLQMQLAGIYLQRGNTAQAYAIYRQVLTEHPDRTDAWKGLIATLQGTNHTNEALQQLGYIPPAIRAELEKDPEFVQTEASVYASAGDLPHAMEYMTRVQKYYAQAGTAMPASLALQNAWLLYNTKDDRNLYPALMRLGSRTDLTVQQRETVQTIWANWAVRRAGAAIDNNENERAVEILEAAMQAFPENIEVKRVLAGGYLRTGQTRRALALYKSLPMENADANGYQGAIGAALAANDRNQAELWLRQALLKYPKDYRILGLAAKFEQARGDNQRAADFLRAAIAAMPANSPADRLAHDLAYPDQDTKPHKATTPGDLQRLLNPETSTSTERFQNTVKLPPLPAYGPDPYLGQAPVIPAPAQTVARQSDIPAAPLTTTETTPRTTVHARTTTSGSASSGTQGTATGAAATTHHAKPAAGSRSSSSARTGKMHIPASDEYITTTDAQPAQRPGQRPSQNAPSQPLAVPAQGAPNDGRRVLPAPGTQEKPQVFIPAPQSSLQPSDAGSQPAFRLSSQPMGDQAAQAQALFAQQTDGQLTQGSAQTIRPLGNAPVTLPGNQPPVNPDTHAYGASGTVHPALSDTQYTPSAQEAATGAYSAQRPSGQPAPARQPNQKQPRQQQPTQQQTVQPPPSSAEPQSTQASGKKHRRRKTEPAASEESVPTLATAPTEQNPSVPPPPDQNPPQTTQAQQQPGQQPPAEPPTDGGLSDEQLQERNLPPLRGPWIKVQRQPRQISPREEAEQQLQTLESGYSGWLGGEGLLNWRSGDLGYSHLAALQAPFEFTAPLGYHLRFALVATPVFLDSGQADGTSVITVQENTTAGRSLVTIPQPLGTMTNTGPSAGGTFTGTPPPQQNSAGVAAEAQLVMPTLGVAFGYTPLGFLVANWTARAQWRPANGPFTFAFTRDSIKDSQLSYSGLRDPGTASLSFPGVIWGGVMADQGNVQFAHGDAQSGFYFGVGGQYITGYNVVTNHRIDGNGGAYWRVKAYPEYGALSVGANFFAMHYANNQDAFTFGMGGYFSPQSYFLANVPFTWEGHQQTRWHYEIVGGLGIQAFQQDLTPLFPLASQKATLIALNNASLPALTSVGANYSFRTNVAYQISPHWFAGGFVNANNARNYNSASVGFSVHYMFRSQPSTVTTPTGLFPSEGLRPFTVP